MSRETAARRSRRTGVRRHPVGAPSRLRIHLFGGFEVWHDGQPLRGFESQKVRALLAYLVLNRGQSFTRDHLAALLWAERDEEAARRNLRQALYNLRETLPAETTGPLLDLEGQSVRCSPTADLWLDVEAFTAALRPAPGKEQGIASHQLAAAANLYRGDLLAGFLLRDCQEFDEWLAVEQERLREIARGALRTLTQALRARGEHRLGIQYARRLVAMDPLAEEAHRDLMQLYAATGQRNRALSHYRDLRSMLARELGVEPLDETKALFQRLLGESVMHAAEAERGTPIRPVVPLVGRDDAIEQLGAAWVAALEGEPRVTLVEGEDGVGKTRLVRSFLDMATTHRPAVVVMARCLDRFPQAPYAPFIAVLRQLLAGDSEDGVLPLKLSPRASRDLAILLPELAAGRPPAGRTLPAAPAADPRRVFAAVAATFAAAARARAAAPTATPLVVFLDDVQWADPATLDLFAHLAGCPAAAPIWLIAAFSRVAGGQTPGRRGRRVIEAAGARAQHVVVRRLTPDDVGDIAASLVPEAQVPELGDLLTAAGGLPLTVVALVNTLWDEGLLVSAEGEQRWLLRASPAELQRIAAGSLDDLIRRRVRRLPSSVRRLSALAALAGGPFDVDLLCRADDEHPAVVEVGIELLLERWLVRAATWRWNPGGLEAGLDPWSRGLRGGSFEFDHERVRRVVADDVNPLRVQVLHGQLAAAIAALRAGDDGLAEELAWHRTEAGEWEAAYRHLREAIDDALARRAPENAVACCDRAAMIAERLAAGAEGAERARWQGARAQVVAIAEHAGSQEPRASQSTIR